MVLVAYMAASCVPQRMDGPDTAVGCWATDDGPDKVFRLKDAVVENTQAHLYEPGFEPESPIQNIWQEIEGTESLEIVINAWGFVGLRMRVELRGDTLRGSIQEWEDVKWDFPLLPFTAFRVECPDTIG